MNIAIIGTGAVGGFYGAKLVLAGHKVSFLSRGSNLESLKKDGLRFESLGKLQTIRNCTFTDKPEELGDLELVLFTVKSYDTQKTAEQLNSYIKPHTIVITPQNGVANTFILADMFGKERVIPAIAKIGSAVPEPGYIKHTGLGSLVIGEFDGSLSDRITMLQKMFQEAGIDTSISQHILADKWKKLVWNGSFNIIAAITGMRTDEILNNAYTKELCINTMKEIITIANKESMELAVDATIDDSITMAEKLGQFKPSTLEDMEKGKPIELDALTGTILSLAQKNMLSVPINTILYALLAGKISIRQAA